LGKCSISIEYSWSNISTAAAAAAAAAAKIVPSIYTGASAVTIIVTTI
jgi:hypothetical protein